MARKGMMMGQGSGYKNVIGRDPAVHSQSAKGIKQAQSINVIAPIQKQEPKSEYDIQAENFLKKTGTTFSTKYYKYDKYFPDDKESRDIYKVTLKNKRGSYTFTFGQSIAESGTGKEPTPYDVLASVTKSDPSTFEDFCGDFGYDADSRKAEKIYKSVVEEYKNISRLFSEEELEQMQEIN